jgi:CII-binding regulator of phage lambda lysogenization HflD
MEEQLKRINIKVQQLLKQYQLLQKENIRLNQAVMDLEGSLQKDRQELDEMKQRVLVLQSSLGQMGEADKAAFEKRINQYIREVDKCINYLSE